jgi:hypothetical protein
LETKTKMAVWLDYHNGDKSIIDKSPMGINIYVSIRYKPCPIQKFLNLKKKCVWRDSNPQSLRNKSSFIISPILAVTLIIKRLRDRVKVYQIFPFWTNVMKCGLKPGIFCSSADRSYTMIFRLPVQEQFLTKCHFNVLKPTHFI